MKEKKEGKRKSEDLYTTEFGVRWRNVRCFRHLALGVSNINNLRLLMINHYVMKTCRCLVLTFDYDDFEQDDDEDDVDDDDLDEDDDEDEDEDDYEDDVEDGVDNDTTF